MPVAIIKHIRSSKGFTLVELIVAMAVFSGMLLIVSAAFISILRLHNQAVAANNVQDSARSAMDSVVQIVRNSTDIANPFGAGGTVYDKTVCLTYATGQKIIYVEGGVLYQADNCATRTNPVPLTSSSVTVAYFMPEFTSSGPDIVRPSIRVTLTVTPNTALGVTNAATHGKDTKCGNSTAQRTFCSVVTLTSGATPR